ncbi:MAG: MFS transporter [Chlamydiales bacterium]
MRLTKPKYFTSFASLNLTQFFAALNDNLYKLILVFFLINLKGAEHSNTILSLAGAIFVIPFLLFASIAGTLADRFSKRSIIYCTRAAEILAMSLGILVFLFKSAVAGYVVLFLMASQSAFFSPCKYGIIPEIVNKNKISHYNGLIVSTTYIAIIVGTFLASFFTDVSHKNFFLGGFLCTLVAIIGTLFSLGIEKTYPQAHADTKKLSARFISDIYRILKKARLRRYLLTTIIFGAYFLFIGAYTQLNIIPFAIQSLHLSEVDGGYLFLMCAIGIGIGSFSAGRLSGKKIELGFVPLSTLGITFCFLALYVFQYSIFTVILFLTLVGFFGGFFTVPVDAFIQDASPDADRGQNVAAANFLSFVGVILASLLLALLGNGFNLKASEGFLVLSIISFFMSILLMLLYADQVLRLIVAAWARLFCHIKVFGYQRIQAHAPALLVAPRTSWLDTVVVMATLPRLIDYIVPIADGKRKRSFLYRVVSMIPVDIQHFSPIGELTVKAIRHEINLGHSVCLMHPVDFPSKTLKEWESKLQQLLKDIKVPLIPIHISRKASPKGGSRLTQLKKLTQGTIRISYGKPLTG